MTDFFLLDFKFYLVPDGKKAEMLCIEYVRLAGKPSCNIHEHYAGKDKKTFAMGRYHWGANAICSFLANDLHMHPWDHRYYTELIKKPYGELPLCNLATVTFRVSQNIADDPLQSAFLLRTAIHQINLTCIKQDFWHT